MFEWHSSHYENRFIEWTQLEPWKPISDENDVE